MRNLSTECSHASNNGIYVWGTLPSEQVSQNARVFDKYGTGLGNQRVCANDGKCWNLTSPQIHEQAAMDDVGKYDVQQHC